jgi:uncharacterized protein (DUF2141 family)
MTLRLWVVPLVSSLVFGQAPRAQVVVEVRPVKDAVGVVDCALFSSAEGFPDDGHAPVATAHVPAQAGTVRCVFEGVKPGRYAVAVRQDRNGNGKLDRNLFGAPVEPWGTTNDVTHTFAGPSFEESAVTLEPGARTLQVTLH